MSFTCPRCHMTSHNINDEIHQYCGNCHKFVDEMKEGVTMPRYELTDQELNHLNLSYTYHPPKDDQPERYVEIRNAAKALAKTAIECAPFSRERSVGLTHLEIAVAMFNKAIACNE